MATQLGLDIVILTLVVAGCAAASFDLGNLLRGQQYRSQYRSLLQPHDIKRADLEQDDGNNPCPNPEAPFPCKSVPECIPLAFMCDGTIDCEDRYDENEDLCTAKHRPPLEEVTMFLQNEKRWIMKTLFANKPLGRVAHALVVSQDLDDFQHRLELSSGEMKNLHTAFQAVDHMDEEQLEDIGMPPAAWNEVNFIFGQLIRSGFGGDA